VTSKYRSTETATPLFKDEWLQTLSDEEKAYEQSLVSHIGKHLDLLGK
jgi:hypothetical protein